MKCIVFTGGGTGGHIYPGLAIAQRLKARSECRIVWIGSTSPLDRSIVEGAGIEFIAIPSGKLRRYFSLRNVTDVFKIVAGFLSAFRRLRRLRPSIVFSKGGFVSVPPCAAAALLRIPVFTHESDFSPGLATKLNLRWAEKVLLAYPDTIKALPAASRSRAVAVGNPVRTAFRSADPRKGRQFLGLSDGERIALVLGGSQGAKQVNDLVVAALPELTQYYTVVHQTGPEQAVAAVSSPRYMSYPYLREELPDILQAAEIVIGRSGAGTVWESATAGKPMVLIPLCGSGTRGDQVENADYFVGRGAAVSLLGAEATSEALSRAVSLIARDGELRDRMATASHEAGALDAAEEAASLILNRIQEV